MRRLLKRLEAAFAAAAFAEEGEPDTARRIVAEPEQEPVRPAHRTQAPSAARAGSAPVSRPRRVRGA